MGLERIGAFWKRTDRNGEMYLSGNFSKKLEPALLAALISALQNGEDIWLKIWPNDKKATDKHPDYMLNWGKEDNKPKGDDYGKARKEK